MAPSLCLGVHVYACVCAQVGAALLCVLNMACLLCASRSLPLSELWTKSYGGMRLSLLMHGAQLPASLPPPWSLRFLMMLASRLLL